MRRTFTLFLLLLLIHLTNFASNLTVTDCLDSLHVTVKPVQCFGLRNGAIYIDSVYGGKAPFYFSLDGHSFSTRPEFDRLWAGTYTLWVRDATGCDHTEEILVPEPEELRIHLMASDSLVVAGKPLTLRAEVLPENVELKGIEWRPPDFFIKHNTLKQAVALHETTTFAIEVYSTKDCHARDQVTVQVEPINVYFPNAFKIGSNQDDYFTVFAGEGISRVLRLQVFNRNGASVFERFDFLPNDPYKGWNGKWRGRYVSPGVFPWVAEIEFLDGRTQVYSGAVTVVR